MSWMSNLLSCSPEEVQGLVSGKLALRHAGRQTDSLKCVAQASKNRSLENFEKVRACRVNWITSMNRCNFFGCCFYPYALFIPYCRFRNTCFTSLLSPLPSISFYLTHFSPLFPPPSLQALTEYRGELRDDPIISTHLTTLYDNLLEQNLIRVIEPFSRVQVSLQLSVLWRVGACFSVQD